MAGTEMPGFQPAVIWKDNRSMAEGILISVYCRSRLLLMIFFSSSLAFICHRV